ncbi:hypothetical protein Hanom_Chr11g01019311 [Helianthus anomalus]
MLEGLAPVVIKKPKPEPHDTMDIPASNPDEPIDLDSSPEPLVRTKAVKRKQADVEATTQPTKKVLRRKNGKRGNLDAFVTKISLADSFCSRGVVICFNDDLPPSSPRASIREQLEGTKAVETEEEKVAEVKKPEEVEKPVEVELEAEKIVETEAVDVGVTQPKFHEVVAREPEGGKSIQEDPVITIPSSATTSTPVNVERSPTGDHGFFTHAEEDSPICSEETMGDYYRSYSEKGASDIHVLVWKLKQGDTFSDWQICRDWLQGVFPPAEVKFQEERSHDQIYHAYLEETANSTSTTHHIVREWRNMHKEWAAFEASKKEVDEEKAKVALLRVKLEADRSKFESEQKIEEWSAASWKRKEEAEAALLSEERKCWREVCEKDNNEKMGLRNGINNLKAEIDKLKKEKAEAEASRDEARSH